MSVCKQCGKELTHNEMAAHLKFIDPTAKEYLCRECIAAYFKVPPERIDEKIEQFRRLGCTMFV